MENKTNVLVSGCYDILHAGHIQFFEDAKSLGTHLTVCFASDEVLMLYKKRKSALPENHKYKILSSLSCVDRVVKSSDVHPIFDFIGHLKGIDILVVTEDDKNQELKRQVCQGLGIQFIILPKRNDIEKVSTTDIRAKIKDLIDVPLRVDFAGGWLDVPKFSIEGAFIVNCTITPKVSLDSWPYEKGSGLGGSAAYSLLEVRNGISDELEKGVGWQDPAIIQETGLCVWRSGEKPTLELKTNPDFLTGKMALYWTGKDHDTASNVERKRNYQDIKHAGKIAHCAVQSKSLDLLAKAVSLSYNAQLDEGMDKLPKFGELAKKYCGGGWGGYALYLFEERPEGFISIEPYLR